MADKSMAHTTQAVAGESGATVISQVAKAVLLRALREHDEDLAAATSRPEGRQLPGGGHANCPLDGM